MTFVIPIARTRWRNAGPYDLSRSGTGNVPMAMPAQHLADVVAHHPGRGALLSLDRPGSGVHPRGCSHHGGCVRCDHFKRALLVSFATAPPHEPQIATTGFLRSGSAPGRQTGPRRRRSRGLPLVVCRAVTRDLRCGLCPTGWPSRPGVEFQSNRRVVIRKLCNPA